MKSMFAVIFLVLSSWLAIPAFADVTPPPVNVNAASAAEIAETLQGIGAAKAEAIVAYRDEHGSFESVEDLTAVKGIGAATLEKNRERISLE